MRRPRSTIPTTPHPARRPPPGVPTPMLRTKSPSCRQLPNGTECRNTRLAQHRSALKPKTATLRHRRRRRRAHRAGRSLVTDRGAPKLLPRLASVQLAGTPELLSTTFVGGLKHLPIRYALD